MRMSYKARKPHLQVNCLSAHLQFTPSEHITDNSSGSAEARPKSSGLTHKWRRTKAPRAAPLEGALNTVAALQTALWVARWVPSRGAACAQYRAPCILLRSKRCRQPMSAVPVDSAVHAKQLLDAHVWSDFSLPGLMSLVVLAGDRLQGVCALQGVLQGKLFQFNRSCMFA